MLADEAQPGALREMQSAITARLPRARVIGVEPALAMSQINQFGQRFPADSNFLVIFTCTAVSQNQFSEHFLPAFLSVFLVDSFLYLLPCLGDQEALFHIIDHFYKFLHWYCQREDINGH